MKIIGNGLLANSFRRYEYDSNFDEHLIFASGVSNSNEQNEDLYIRETNMLIETILSNQNKKIVYFSSTGLDNKKSKYFEHKMKIESVIQNNTSRYLIIRCPQVVGPTLSPTLVKTFVDLINKGKDVHIQKYSTRDIVDVNDVVRLTSKLTVLKKKSNLIINLCTGNNIPVIKIAKKIASLMNKDLKTILTDDGDRVISDPTELQKYIALNDEIFECNYWENVLKKNIPLILNKLNSNDSTN